MSIAPFRETRHLDAQAVACAWRILCHTQTVERVRHGSHRAGHVRQQVAVSALRGIQGIVSPRVSMRMQARVSEVLLRHWFGSPRHRPGGTAVIARSGCPARLVVPTCEDCILLDQDRRPESVPPGFLHVQRQTDIPNARTFRSRQHTCAARRTRPFHLGRRCPRALGHEQ